MADLDQISAMIGGLQADMRRAIEWFDKHEDADQRRFEELRLRIEASAERQSERVTALELHKAETAGGWKVASIIGTLTGAAGAFIYHIVGAWRG